MKRGDSPPNARNTKSALPNIVIISGVGSRDFIEFEEIWTVERRENLFHFFKNPSFWRKTLKQLMLLEHKHKSNSKCIRFVSDQPCRVSCSYTQ